MANDVRGSPLRKNETSTTNFNHQYLNICVPRTELDVFGPGFIEVCFRLLFIYLYLPKVMKGLIAI